MLDWLRSVLSSVSFSGVKSRRLVSVVVGCVLLVWLYVGLATRTLPEIPLSVLMLVAMCVGTVAIDRPAA